MPSDPLMKDAHKGVRIGRYQIMQHIATGGMGAVYKAIDSETNQIVALKVLPPELAARPLMLKRFCQEARSASKLRHENIVSIHEFGETNDTYYLALEYIDGVDLLKYINDQGSVDPGEALQFIIQATRALDHAHLKGFVHRDIKPANFLLSVKDGKSTIKLTDMGLAREVSDDDFQRLTMAGTTVGTIDYMSPEQARDSGSADIRSDIYALGCTWYHMLMGSPPFAQGSLTERLFKHMTEPPADICPMNSKVTGQMMAVIWKMLEKKRLDRYQTPAELLEDLHQLEKPAKSSPSISSSKTPTKDDVGGHTKPDVGPPALPPQWQKELGEEKPRKPKIKSKPVVDEMPTALMPSAARQQAAAGQFIRAEQVIADGNYDYGFRLLHEACKLDPGHLMYRQAFRAAQKTKYANNGRGSALAWLTTLPLKAKLKNAKRNGDQAKMLEVGERILSHNPWDLGTQMDMAEAAQQLGSDNMAIWFLEQAQETHTEHVPLNRALAALYERRGSMEQAMALWQAIREADPQDDEARQKVKSLACDETIAKSIKGLKERRYGKRVNN